MAQILSASNVCELLSVEHAPCCGKYWRGWDQETANEGRKSFVSEGWSFCLLKLGACLFYSVL